jgi:hypothetical protein
VEAMTGVDFNIGGKIIHLSEESAQMLIDRLKKQGKPIDLDIAAKIEERLIRDYS